MKLIFATHNPNKLKEIQAMMPAEIDLVSLADLDFHEEIEETEPTIKGNATLKVEAIVKRFNLPCFADDTGLEVDALNGAPGVKSARYAGEEKNSQANMEKLLTQLEGQTHRGAQFKTVIAYSDTKGNIKHFTGICKGRITHSARGEGGFGYDPIFEPLGYQQTFAELSPQVKQTIGHRGQAFKAFISSFN